MYRLPLKQSEVTRAARAHARKLSSGLFGSSSPNAAHAHAHKNESETHTQGNCWEWPEQKRIYSPFHKLRAESPKL